MLKIVLKLYRKCSICEYILVSIHCVHIEIQLFRDYPLIGPQPTTLPINQTHLLQTAAVELWIVQYEIQSLALDALLG